MTTTSGQATASGTGGDAACLVVDGGTPLTGDVRASGAKNSALKLLAAALLAPGRTTITNVPAVSDVATMLLVLEGVGVAVERPDPGTVHLTVPATLEPVADYELTSKMRASIQVLGPLLARCGSARVSMPGGCNLGARKLDMHLDALEQMGTVFTNDHGDLVATTDGLKGRRICLDFPSMGATENVILAAVAADGDTEIDNAAREPEIEDLCAFLNAMGARIEGAGTPTISIAGGVVDSLGPVTHRTIADRIEVGTYLVAGPVTGGSVTVRDCDPSHLGLFLDTLAAIGVDVETGDDWVRAGAAPRGLRAHDFVTLPYPGFPTDLQPQVVALLGLAEGTSVVTENLFDGRYQYVYELNRMGAHISTDGRHAVVTGVDGYQGAPVVAHDIRAGAAVVCAALAADGQSSITNVHLIDRGYERIVDKLQGLGASIERK